MIDSTAFIHPTALIENDVSIGAHTAIWDNVHIRKKACVGHDCIVGEKTHIAYDVEIGNYVKINAMVFIPTAVIIEDFVMISAGTVFTNDKFPRAFRQDLSGLASSEPGDETLRTVVRKGVTIGANATIGCGIEVGQFSMVGMGSVVTRTVLPHSLVYGNPATHRGYVCTCGCVLVSFDDAESNEVPEKQATCYRCARTFRISGDLLVTEIT
jgi:UDP-2-acetamido-3-amino-2,3-dideoxy-glucuronate N-acetyltransferase